MQLGSTTYYISCNLDFMLDHISTINYLEWQICVILVPEYIAWLLLSVVLIYFIALFDAMTLAIGTNWNMFIHTNLNWRTQLSMQKETKISQPRNYQPAIIVPVSPQGSSSKPTVYLSANQSELCTC